VQIDKVAFIDRDGKTTSVFRTWDPWRIDVHYSCPENLSKHNLGFVMTIEREADLLRVAQFNTCNPSGRDDSRKVISAFERPPGRKGVLSCNMPELQLLEGDYILSLALQPNVAGLNEYYEYHQRVHRFTVIPAAYTSGAVFYPFVEWRHMIMEQSGLRKARS
jgi:hypothetical protein